MVAHPCFEVVSYCVDCGSDAVHLLFFSFLKLLLYRFFFFFFNIPLGVTSKSTTDTIS